MNTSTFPSQGEDKIKSYWNRPGGKFGTIAGIILLGIAGFYLAPIFTAIVWNIVNFGIACAAGLVAFVVLTNRRLWLNLFYFYEVLMKMMTGLVIQIDPFIIAEDYIQDMKKERQNLSAKTIEVDGQKEVIVQKIKEKEHLKQKQLNIASAAQKEGDGLGLGNATRQVARLDQYIEQLSPIRDNLQRVGDYLSQVYKNSKYMIEDMENELELKKDLFNSVTKGNNALQSAMTIFNGDAEKKLMVEQSMNYLKDDIGNKLASMKMAISCSADFMKSIDLENASYQEEGLKMLEQYRPEMFSLNENKQITNLPINYSSSVPASSSYDNLIQ